MSSSLLGLAPEFAELFVLGLGSAGLSVLGIYAERTALTALRSGELVTALWVGALGAVVLAFAYLLVTDKLLPGVTTVTRGGNES